MTATAWIAAYGAVISTSLAVIGIYNFMRDRQIIFVEERHLYFRNDAIYTIFLSNISSRNVTIVDCQFQSMAVNESGKLKPFCGHTPYHNDSLMDDREDKSFLICPIIIRSGEVLILSLESEQIRNAVKGIKGHKSEFDYEWRRTDIIELSLLHSYSAKTFTYRFPTRHDEHSLSSRV